MSEVSELKWSHLDRELLPGYKTWQSALSRLSSVCHRWQLVARCTCFESIIIDKIKSLNSLKDAITASYELPPLPPIGPFVARAAFYDEGSERIDLFLVSRTPKCLPNLETLVWNGKNTPWSSDSKSARAESALPPRISTTLLSMFQHFLSVHTLSLQHHSFTSFRQLARLVSSLSSLVQLELEEVTWPPFSLATLPPWPCRPSSLRKVSLELEPPVEETSGTCFGLSWLFLGKNAGKSLHTPRPFRLLREDAEVLVESLSWNSQIYHVVGGVVEILFTGENCKYRFDPCISVFDTLRRDNET